MKKFLAAALALVLGVSLAGAAFAEGLNPPGGEAVLPAAEGTAPKEAPLAEQAPKREEGAPGEEGADARRMDGGATQVSTQEELTSALSGASQASDTPTQLQLSGDITLTAALTVASGRYVSLDLNGHTLTAASGERHLKVNGALTLADSAGGGSLDGGGNGGGVEVNASQGSAAGDGVFTMKGGAIANCKRSTAGGGVYVDGGAFNMADGVISGCVTSNTKGGNPGGGVYLVSGGTFTMTGGAIRGCSSETESQNPGNGGGVYLKDSTFTLDGGVIENCAATSAQNSTASGGGVYLAGRGTFTMTGGTIRNCTATASGGGVYVNYTGMFTMENGAIEGCTTAYFGGGVGMSGGTFTMKGNAVITGCKAAGDDGDGGGVYVGGDATLAGNAAITNCTAAGAGGGVYVSARKEITVSGAPRVEGNRAGGGVSNLFLNSTAGDSCDGPEYAQVAVGGALDPGTSLGLTLGGEALWDGQTAVKTNLGGAPSAADLRRFFPDSAPDTHLTSGTVDSAGKFAAAPNEEPAPITPDTGISLDKTALTLAPGETAKLKATLTPGDATYKYIFWTADKTDVATVSDSGLVTAVSEGTATITAKSWYGHEANCEVTVKQAETPPPADPWPTEGLAGFVTRCYRVALGRDPDRAGHADWVRWLSDGTVDASSCAYGFVFSQEMNDKHLSDEAFIRTLYRLFLDREGEPTGVAFWVDYLKAGHGREEVFGGFADSVEFSRVKAGYGLA